ncbi:Isoprene synthase, chloroplastic [Sesamum angolense]|uniref:Isoprene synthase, chloroplastic n=1 Tax=Sesamum angolense TaxID=2727404 RepID=A0AAE1XAN9_9LAMI|nr:Isoprene synthase, chloroplastic [Sesamum angolense]
MKQAFLPSNIQLMRWKIQCTPAAQQSVSYQPSSWSYDFIQSIGDDHMNHVMEVEEDAQKKMEDEASRTGFKRLSTEPLREFYFRPHKLNRKCMRTCIPVLSVSGSLEDMATMFLQKFGTDVEGMLSLYEASHLALDGESTLDKAREFTGFHLKNMLGKMDMKSAMRVNRALELPSHHRMQRLEARWNIEMYDKQDKANQLLRKLATLDFNLVQKVHQRDLQEASRWWRHVGLANKLSFARDRLMESFFWTVGMISEPQFSKCRVGLTKVVKLITVLDDIYDVYGSADELELLTNAVHKWDVNAVNDLPDYMKLFFFALYKYEELHNKMKTREIANQPGVGGEKTHAISWRQTMMVVRSKDGDRKI